MVFYPGIMTELLSATQISIFPSLPRTPPLAIRCLSSPVSYLFHFSPNSAYFSLLSSNHSNRTNIGHVRKKNRFHGKTCHESNP